MSTIPMNTGELDVVLKVGYPFDLRATGHELWDTCANLSMTENQVCTSLQSEQSIDHSHTRSLAGYAEREDVSEKSPTIESPTNDESLSEESSISEFTTITDMSFMSATDMSFTSVTDMSMSDELTSVTDMSISEESSVDRASVSEPEVLTEMLASKTSDSECQQSSVGDKFRGGKASLLEESTDHEENVTTERDDSIPTAMMATEMTADNSMTTEDAEDQEDHEESEQADARRRGIIGRMGKSIRRVLRRLRGVLLPCCNFAHATS